MQGVALTVAVLVGCVMLWRILSRRQRQRTWRNEPFYHGRFKQRLRQPLVSWEYGISGQPDYVVEHDGQPIPVLARSGLAPGNAPHDSHVAQVLVYCLLFHETTGSAPPYGIVRYGDRTFEVDYSESAVDALLDLLEEIRAVGEELPPRSHDVGRHCFACRHRRICDESLV